MTLSRKDFLRQAAASLGKALFDPASLVRDDAPALPPAEGEARPGKAVPRNDRCLAHRGGCFCCIDSCPAGAIAIELGTGISIDPERCDGCGSCAAICPVTPKALEVIRSTDSEGVRLR
jgi:ferredoxin